MTPEILEWWLTDGLVILGAYFVGTAVPILGATWVFRQLEGLAI